MRVLVYAAGAYIFGTGALGAQQGAGTAFVAKPAASDGIIRGHAGASRSQGKRAPSLRMKAHDVNDFSDPMASALPDSVTGAADANLYAVAASLESSLQDSPSGPGEQKTPSSDDSSARKKWEPVVGYVPKRSGFAEASPSMDEAAKVMADVQRSAKRSTPVEIEDAAAVMARVRNLLFRCTI